MSNPKIICFAGPDKCGKTQIAKTLADQLEIPYYKATSEQTQFVKNQERFIKDIQWSCPARLDLLKQMIDQGYVKGVVYDRCWVCESVYSTLYKRITDSDAIYWLDEQYAKLGAIIIIPYRSSYRGIVDDLDPTLDENKLKELEKLYRNFAAHSKCKVLFLNVDSENLDVELREINKFLEKA